MHRQRPRFGLAISRSQTSFIQSKTAVDESSMKLRSLRNQQVGRIPKVSTASRDYIGIRSTQKIPCRRIFLKASSFHPPC